MSGDAHARFCESRGVRFPPATHLVRSAIRGLLRRDDEYASAGKPVCDYDDRAAREALVDALAKDARALLTALNGRALPDSLGQALTLLAAVTGQDLDKGRDGIFRIARRVAKDRVISTVDPEARHGHKTSAHSFDGYKGHVAIDPDSELITATTVSAGNRGDAAAAADLLAADLPAAARPAEVGSGAAEHAQPSSTVATTGGPAGQAPLTVYGDAAYGAGEVLERLETAHAVNRCKVQPPVAPNGRFSKDAFVIDLQAGTATCPEGHMAVLASNGDGFIARFGDVCAICPLAGQCTTAKTGRTVHVGPYEAQLATARAEQSDPAWRADYQATRPKVERKLAHLMRRRHGGRRARVRGQPKVAADFALLAAAVNLARLAALALTGLGGRWAAQAA